MMDFGFGAVLEKFEEYFGKGVTRVLLILIGLAIAAGCVGLIWTWFVGPVLAFFHKSAWTTEIIKIALAALGIGGGIAFGLLLIAGFGLWRISRQARRMTEQAEADYSAVQVKIEKLDETYNILAENRKKSWGALEKATAVLRSILDQHKDRIDEQKRKELEETISDAEKTLAEHAAKDEEVAPRSLGKSRGQPGAGDKQNA